MVLRAWGTTWITVSAGSRQTALSGPAVPSLTLVRSAPSTRAGAMRSTCPSARTAHVTGAGLVDVAPEVVVVVALLEDGGVPSPGITVVGSTAPTAMA